MSSTISWKADRGSLQFDRKREPENNESIRDKRVMEERCYPVFDNYEFQSNESRIGLVKDGLLIIGKQFCQDGTCYFKVNLIDNPNPSPYKQIFNKENYVIYEGYINNKLQFEGFGIQYEYVDNQRRKVYEGLWKGGKRDGEGKVYFKEQPTYFRKVLYEDGKLLRSLYTESIKNRIQGEFRGNGQYDYVELLCEKENYSPLKVFTGFIDNSEKYVYGTEYYHQGNKNNPRYCGYYKDNRYHGEGTFYSNSHLVFCGSFENGKPRRGIIRFQNIDIYEGEVNEYYQMDGEGEMYNFESIVKANKNEKVVKYRGHFEKNKCSGFGKLYSISGELVYCGYFKNNLFDGKGVFFKRRSDRVIMIGAADNFRIQEFYNYLYDERCTKSSFDAFTGFQDCWEESMLKNGTKLFIDNITYELTWEGEEMKLTETANNVTYSSKVKKSEQGIDLGVLIVERYGPITRSYEGGYDITDKNETRYYSKSGELYFQGRTINFVPNGQGTYTDHKEDRKFKGEWVDGKLTQGKMYMHSDSKYLLFFGKFYTPITYSMGLKGLLCGNGNIYLIREQDTVLMYMGGIKDGRYHGKGKEFKGPYLRYSKYNNDLAGCTVYEGEYVDGKCESPIIRDYSQRKDNYTCFVTEPIALTAFTLSYFENEMNGEREYCSLVKKEGEKEEGLYFNGNHVRMGVKQNAEWEGSVLSYDVTDIRSAVDLFAKDPNAHVLLKYGEWKWKRIYKEGKYTGSGEYSNNGYVYAVNNNYGTRKGNGQEYEGELKEIEKDGDYYCVREGQGRLKDDKYTYEGTWENDKPSNVKMILSENEYQMIVYVNNKLIVKEHVCGSVHYVFNGRNNEVSISNEKNNGLVKIYEGGYIPSNDCKLDRNNRYLNACYLPNGYGKEYNDGILIYKGSFYQGFRHGKGEEFRGENDVVYAGMWEYDKKVGKGVLYLGDLQIDGNFKDNTCMGNVMYKNKLVFTGLCYDNRPYEGSFFTTVFGTQLVSEKKKVESLLKQRTATLVDLKNQKLKVFEGGVSVDETTWTLVCNGHGKYYFDQYTVYEGLWENNVLQGEYTIKRGSDDIMTCKTENGKSRPIHHVHKKVEYLLMDNEVTIKEGGIVTYQGCYVENEQYFQTNTKPYIPNGKGKLFEKNVLVYEGDFKNGKYCGEGTKYVGNGVTLFGTFTSDSGCTGTIMKNDQVLFDGVISRDEPYSGKFYTVINGILCSSQKITGNDLKKSVVTFVDGKNNCVYEGYVRWDKTNWELSLSGSGVLYMNGNKYQGTFIDNDTIQNCQIVKKWPKKNESIGTISISQYFNESNPSHKMEYDEVNIQPNSTSVEESMPTDKLEVNGNYQEVLNPDPTDYLEVTPQVWEIVEQTENPHVYVVSNGSTKKKVIRLFLVCETNKP